MSDTVIAYIFTVIAYIFLFSLLVFCALPGVLPTYQQRRTIKTIINNARKHVDEVEQATRRKR